MRRTEVTSCGIIPLQIIEGNWHVLLIQHVSGDYWSFPKGHLETGETSKECALRELSEETGLEIVRFIKEDPLQEHYQFTGKQGLVLKTVIYFIAEVKGTVKLQHTEIVDFKWCLIKHAAELLTFPAAKQLFEAVLKVVKDFDGSNA